MTKAAPRIAFEKWEGLGNDFVVIGPQVEVANPSELARELCDRRRGIGADGLLLVEAASGARPRMIVYNADGSRPEMCGNGLRCVAGFLDSAEAETLGARELLVSTDAGDKRCAIRRAGPGRYDVEVNMGTARIGEEIRVVIEEREHRFLMVDVGNPHAITFEPYDQAAIDSVGPLVATSKIGGTNVEFCRVLTGPEGTKIDVVVWERGVGRTLACGTGACAVAAAACETKRASYGVPIVISLPGGDLEVTVLEGRREMLMRGPARRVFMGELVRT